MSTLLFNWVNKDAKWHQIWLPQSGFVGGFTFGMIIVAAEILLWKSLYV